MTENKGDLISREALKKSMWEESHSIATFTECGTEEAHIGLTVNEIEHIIDIAPTVEPTFREVVAYECGQKSVERPQGECKSCRHRDPEDLKCDCGGKERQGCPFPVSDDYYCKYYEKCGAE